MTLFTITKIIKHCFENLTLANKQNLSFPTKFNKRVKNPQKEVKIVIFIPKITNTFDFSSPKSKKNIGHFFLGLFTWNHLKTKLYCGPRTFITRKNTLAIFWHT